MSGLRKDTWKDGYVATGSLEGVDGPGRRTVRRLELRNLTSATAGDLSVLSKFPDLETLVLNGVEDVDLAPLAELRLRDVDIHRVSGLDLAPLQRTHGLERVSLFNFDRCQIPDPFRLPSTLRRLGVANDDPGLTGAPVKRCSRRSISIAWRNCATSMSR